MKIARKHKIEKVCSDDKLRYAINNVKAYKHRLVATNGHAMAVIPYKKANIDIPEEEFTGLIPPEVFNEARKVNKKFERDDMIIEHNGKLTVKDYSTGTEKSFNYIDEPYPDVVRVIPRRKTEYKISLNAKLLYELSQALGCDGVILEFTGKTSGIIVKPHENSLCTEDNHAWGILMPKTI